MHGLVSVSAPYSLILLGDYAVTTGQPCIAVPLPQQVTITAKVDSQRGIFLTLPELRLSKYALVPQQDTIPELAIIERISRVITQRFDSLPGIHITLTEGWLPDDPLMSIPLATCVIKCVLKITGITLPKQEIMDAVCEVLTDSQTGINAPQAAVAVWGKSIYYHNQPKELILLPLAAKVLPLIVTPVNLSATTFSDKKITWWKHHKEAVAQRFTNLAQLVEDGKRAIERHDLTALGWLMNKHQKIFTELELSSEEVHQACVKAMLNGAYGAKSAFPFGNRVVALVEK